MDVITVSAISKTKVRLSFFCMIRELNKLPERVIARSDHTYAKKLHWPLHLLILAPSFDFLAKNKKKRVLSAQLIHGLHEILSVTNKRKKKYCNPGSNPTLTFHNIQLF